jgi:hypothetical protein
MVRQGVDFMVDRCLLRLSIVAILACCLLPALKWGQSDAWAQTPGGPSAQPVKPAIGPDAAQPNEHPLMPVLRWGQKSLKIAEKIQDYSATMVKRERIDGKTGEPEYMFIKVRQKPMSVYLYCLKPDHLKGQEALWIQGQNNGKMWGHAQGIRKVFGTVPLDPTGPIAMKGNRYPITEIGLLNLVRRLIEEGEKDTQYGECEVKYFQGAKINGRSCTCIQVVHPIPRRNFQFHLARIFVDDEYNLPVRFEAYDWPTQQGAQPELIEEYTYVNIKMNNGFTDADFDLRNPAYGFKSR